MKLHEISQQDIDDYDAEGFLDSRKEIEEWLHKHIDYGYTINDDLTVDLAISILIEDEQTHHLPVQFGMVEGSFTLKNCLFTSLKGCPRVVEGEFELRNLQLIKSLEHSPVRCSAFTLWDIPGLSSFEFMPQDVKDDIWVQRVRINSFEHFTRHVKGTLALETFNGQKFSLIGINEHIESIAGLLNIVEPQIKDGGIGILLTGLKYFSNMPKKGGPLEIIEKYLGRPEDIFECQAELIHAGFEEFSKL